MAPAFDLLIRNAEVVDADGEHGIIDVGISGGIIVAVEPELPGDGLNEIDAAGLMLLPGIVDSHAHLTDVDRHDFGLGGDEARFPARGSVSGRSPVHGRLAMAGVTTAVEFYDFSAVLDQWHASTVGLTVLGLQNLPTYQDKTPRHRIRDFIDAAVEDGALGIKLIGGHYPNTPEISGMAIAECDDAGSYVAFHAGTTAHGSNLDGMREALELADGRPLHLAHTNAYLRGAVADTVEENNQALGLLSTHRQVVSEAHLAPFNDCTGAMDGDTFVDEVTSSCLKLGGYTANRLGVLQAFADGFAHSLRTNQEGCVPVTGDVGRRIWEANPGGNLHFPVNRRITGFMQACARRHRDGSLQFDGPGEFVVDAISSDGGDWRNVILDKGLTLVGFGALTLPQFALKTSQAPAAMFGLSGKGKIRAGYDADVIVVDAARRKVRFTVASGQVIYDGKCVIGTGGTVVTTEQGAKAVQERQIPHKVVDLSQSTFRTKGSSRAR